MSRIVLINTRKAVDLDLNSHEDSSLTNLGFIKWRHKFLWVDSKCDAEQVYLPALQSEDWLAQCLEKSSAHKICLDPDLDMSTLKTWILAANKADKDLLIRTVNDRCLREIQNSWNWKFKRGCDFLISTILLLFAAPIIILIALQRKLLGNEMFRLEDCVGYRGIIFQKIHFGKQNSSKNNHASSNSKSFFNKVILLLPQLINVMKGDMSFVGRYSYSLNESLTLDNTERKILNVIPGLITPRLQQKSSSDLTIVAIQDRKYLSDWSLELDIKTLLLKLPLIVFEAISYKEIS